MREQNDVVKEQFYETRFVVQPGGRQEQNLLNSGSKQESAESLLRQIRKALNRTYENNSGSHAVKYSSTIQILQPLMEQFKASKMNHILGKKHRKLVAEAYNDLAVSLAEKAWLENAPFLRCTARNHYLSSLRHYPSALTARNLGRLLDTLKEWIELKDLMDWSLSKFPNSAYGNEFSRMLSKACRNLRLPGIRRKDLIN